MTPLGIAFLNGLEFREQVRGDRAEMDVRSDSLFWNTDYRRRVDCERSKTRVLVCGSLGIGKSTIINLILERTAVCIASQDYAASSLAKVHLRLKKALV